MSVGAGRLYRENLDENKRAIIDGIAEQVKIIRENHDDRYEHNNFISILGGRGYGKTSLALTVLSDIRAEEKGDIILDLIDPARFNVEKNVLGWIIVMIGKEIKKLGEATKNHDFCNGGNRKYEELKKKFEAFKSNYIKSRSVYTKKGTNVVDGSYGVSKVMEEALFADVTLKDNFKTLIDNLVDFIADKNKEKGNLSEKPLVFITFDDLDISPQYSSDIINTMLSYLSHKSIVVIILGDYNTFKESKIIDLWNENDIPSKFGTDICLTGKTLLSNISRRSDHILEKAMPAYLRHQIKTLSLRDRLTFTPYGRKEDQSGKAISEFSNMVEGIKIEDKTMGDYLSRYQLDKSFIEETLNNYEKLNKTIKNTSRKRKVEDNIIELKCRLENATDKVLLDDEFPYSNIIGKTPRNIINLYNILKTSKLLKEIEIKNPVKARSYTERTEIYKQNFDNLKLIYKSFSETNKDIYEEKSEFGSEKIFGLDEKLNRFYFNFKDIKITAVPKILYEEFNVSSSLLKIIYEKKDEKKYTLNDSQSALFQFIYDMCEMYLDDNYYIVEGSMDLSNIWIYRKNKYNIDVRMHNFPRFELYYKMKKRYEVLIPIIYGDGNTQKEVNKRLKDSLMIALELKDNKLNSLENEFGNADTHIKFNSIDNDYSKSNIIDFIKYFDKPIDPLEDFLYDYKKISFYAKVCIEYTTLLFSNYSDEKKRDILKKMNRENLAIDKENDLEIKLQKKIENGETWKDLRRELKIKFQLAITAVVLAEGKNGENENGLYRLMKLKEILIQKEKSITDQDLRNDLKDAFNHCYKTIDMKRERVKLGSEEKVDKEEDEEKVQIDKDKSLEMLFQITGTRKAPYTKYDEIMGYLDKISFGDENIKHEYKELLELKDFYSKSKKDKISKSNDYKFIVLPMIFRMMDKYVERKIKYIFNQFNEEERINNVKDLAIEFNDITGPTRTDDLGKEIDRCRFIHSVAYKKKEVDIEKIKQDFGIEEDKNE